MCALWERKGKLWTAGTQSCSENVPLCSALLGITCLCKVPVAKSCKKCRTLSIKWHDPFHSKSPYSFGIKSSGIDGNEVETEPCVCFCYVSGAVKETGR